MQVDLKALDSLIAGLGAQFDAFAGDKLKCFEVSADSSGCFLKQASVIEKNGRVRTFDHYDTNAMCATCTACWHVDRAIAVLQDLKALANNAALARNEPTVRSQEKI